MHKRKKKIVVPILVVILFLGLAFAPGICATAEKVKEHQITVRMQDPVSGEDYAFRRLVTHDQLEKVNDTVNEYLMLAKDSMDENSPGGSEISEAEWEIIEEKILTVIDILGTIIGKNFPVEETKNYVTQVLSTLLKFKYTIRQPLISVGVGITWIPFYDYESMLGKLIKPIFIHHVLGFSATFKINPFKLGFPSFSYGLHRIRTFFFNGLLIDFSNLGYDRILGPQVLIGYGFFTGFA